MKDTWENTSSDGLNGGGSHWAFKLAGAVALLALGAMVVLPLLQAGSRVVNRRLLSVPVPNTVEWVRHLTLWTGLLGALFASWKDRHLAIAVGEAVRSSAWKARFSALSRGGAVGILVCLTVSSTQLGLAYAGMGDFGQIGGWLPLWVAMAPMPLAFGAMTVATYWRPGEAWSSRFWILLLALLVGPVLVLIPLGDGAFLRAVGILAICMLAGVGMPLFAALGGTALLLFFLDPAGSVTWPLDQTYRITSEGLLPCIPLFVLAGVILARGEAATRLIKVARTWTGWVPGGASVATILACAFFTAVTGASGVTILALGGLLLPVLIAAKHTERFSLGLVTASGSVGLLFFPSIPVILYAVRGSSMVAPLGVKELFLAGLIPGMLLLLILAAYSMFQVRSSWATRPSFTLREAMGAARIAWGDLLLPVLVVVAFFGGLMTLVETAALVAVWAFLLEFVVHRTLRLRKDLLATFFESCLVVGALVAVIGMAFGLFSFLMDHQVPETVATWLTSTIESKLVFLLVLNVLLLVVGALIDIFSAIVLIVPILAAVAPEYGIGPAHLGIVFLANLELGYLTPPVGMNLFLSSLTFDKPVLKVWRAALPFLAIFAIWVLLVTYVPFLSQGIVDLVLGR